MIPIKQKLMHDHENSIKGDCLRACICSLLEISDDGVPNFVEDKNYPEQLSEFLWSRGYDIVNGDEPPEGIEFYMAWGISPRGVMHSVIHSQGKLVHDPNPDGGDVKPKYYVWLEPISR
jgi:hypothetical protein